MKVKIMKFAAYSVAMALCINDLHQLKQFYLENKFHTLVLRSPCSVLFVILHLSVSVHFAVYRGLYYSSVYETPHITRRTLRTTAETSYFFGRAGLRTM